MARDQFGDKDVRSAAAGACCGGLRNKKVRRRVASSSESPPPAREPQPQQRQKRRVRLLSKGGEDKEVRSNQSDDSQRSSKEAADLSDRLRAAQVEPQRQRRATRRRVRAQSSEDEAYLGSYMPEPNVGTSQPSQRSTRKAALAGSTGKFDQVADSDAESSLQLSQGAGLPHPGPPAPAQVQFAGRSTRRFDQVADSDAESSLHPSQGDRGHSAGRYSEEDELERRQGQRRRSPRGQKPKRRRGARQAGRGQLLADERELRFPLPGTEASVGGSQNQDEEVERFLRRKQAVMDLRLHNTSRQARIGSLASHNVDLRAVRETLTAPAMSFDWQGGLEEDSGEEQEQGRLEVDVPTHLPHRDSRRDLFKDQMRQTVSRLLAKDLGREREEGARDVNKEEVPHVDSEEEVELSASAAAVGEKQDPHVEDVVGEEGAAAVPEPAEASVRQEAAHSTVRARRVLRRVVDDDDDDGDGASDSKSQTKLDAEVRAVGQEDEGQASTGMTCPQACPAAAPPVESACGHLASGDSAQAALTTPEPLRAVQRLRHAHPQNVPTHVPAAQEEEDPPTPDDENSLNDSEVSEPEGAESDSSGWAGEETSRKDADCGAHRTARWKLRLRQAQQHQRKLRFEVQDAEELGGAAKLLHLGTATMSEEDRLRWKKTLPEGFAGLTGRTVADFGLKKVAPLKQLVGSRGGDDTTHLYGFTGAGSKRVSFMDPKGK